MKKTLIMALFLALVSGGARASDQSAAQGNATPIASGDFRWTTGGPVLATPLAADEDWLAVKDPSLVRYGDRWHVFCTVRSPSLGREIMAFSFDDWSQAGKAERHLMSLQAAHPGAPQVFYFTPHKKWYLICQASREDWTPSYGAAYATAADLTAPGSWSPLKPLGAKRVPDAKKPEGKAGLDFWVICDARKAYLFFTTNDGRMWREETRLEDFPVGWSEPALAIRGDIFEASHTYKIKGQERYLTIVEAQGGHGWRYFKAYTAERLDGAWEPLAAEKDRAFASMRNVRQTGVRWTDSISHGELIRTGYDERLEVDAADMRFVFQGVADQDRKGKGYGLIPWSLGILEFSPGASPSH